MAKDEKTDSARIASELREQGVEHVHVGLFDDFGMFRERRFHIDRCQPVFAGQLRFPNVLMRWDATDDVIGGADISTEPLQIDLSSERRYPFEPHAALFVADYTGPCRDTAPRPVLDCQVRKAWDAGFTVRASFEFEAILLDESDATLREKNFQNLKPLIQENRCWSGASAAQNADLLADLEAQMASLDIPLHCVGLELGPGCLEITLDATDGVRAADNAALFKVFTRAFARRRGLTASFMAKLDRGYPGLSGHIHLSLWDKSAGRPLFHDANATDGMSALMRHFLGGLLKLMPEAMIMGNHTVNSFRRMTPGTWAPRTASWGFDNYTCAVRVMTDTPETCRLEYRVPGSDTHPHLALALMLGAGLYGIENRIELPAPTVGDAREVPIQPTTQLPRNLLEAAERFQASTISRDLFGDGFVSRFTANRIAEEVAFRPEVSAFERRRYLEII